MIDHTNHSFNVNDLPWPTDWAQIFGQARPLILEIGFGQGHYLLNLAEQNPDAHILGVEIANRSLSKVEDAIARRGLTHVGLIYARAEAALHHLFEPQTLSQIHVNFPDPWFKSNHHHRRLMQRATLDMMVNRLQPGGLFFLATDIVEYAGMSARLLAETPGLDNLYESPWHDSAPPGRFVTKYEARAHEEGRACHYFAYRRNLSPAPDVPVIKELPMPHIIFTMPLDLDAIQAQVERREFHFGETHIKIMSIYRGEHELLLEVYIREPTIDQHVSILLSNRAEAHEYTLKLGRIGNPRPTDGVHKAIAALGEWLTSLHPDTAILNNSVRS